MPDLGNAAIFSQTDASNASGTMPSWSGAAAPSTLDDSGRALQGAITREWNWRSYTLTAGGTSDAKTLTFSVAPAAYYNGQRFAFIANTTNTTTATLNVNSLGAKTIKKDVSGTLTNLSASDMVSGMFVEVAYNTSNDCFVWVNNNASTAYAQLASANTFTASQTISGGNPGLVLNGNTDFTPQIQMAYGGATAHAAPYLIINRARGTYSSPTIVSSGDQVGSILFQAHDGSSYRGVADIEAVVDGTTGATDTPGRLLFKTCADGAAGALTERMRIDSSGNVGIGTTTLNQQLQVGNSTDQAGLYQSGNVSALYLGGPSSTAGAGVFRVRYDRAGGSGYFVTGTTSAATDAIILNNSIFGPLKDGLGLGYSTGSGGTVTQITSKSTGVTLNKTNGQIVTHNANVSATVPVSFVVTNSTVAATDTVIVHRASGGTNASYAIGCDAVSAGSFRVYISNISGGGLAEALTLNFAVIKAVTS